MGSPVQAALLQALGIGADPGAATNTRLTDPLSAQASDPSYLTGLRRNTYAPPAPDTSAPADTSYAPSANPIIQGGYANALSPAEAWIVGHESGGNVHARNPSSGAFGIGQLNPSSGTLQGIAHELHVDPYTTNYQEQLAMMRAYIGERYGTAQNAQAFWQAHGWY